LGRLSVTTSFSTQNAPTPPNNNSHSDSNAPKNFAKEKLPGTRRTGMVVRAAASKIDGWVQPPDGLVIPEVLDTRRNQTPAPRFPASVVALEKATELAFLQDQNPKQGDSSRHPTRMVLHPFGRYCCAEQICRRNGSVRGAPKRARTLQHRYKSPQRTAALSMGGASAWQFGTHFTSQWAAVAPGAGFAETAEFCKVFADGKTPPPWWEQVLYRWYDSTLVRSQFGQRRDCLQRIPAKSTDRNRPPTS